MYLRVNLFLKNTAKKTGHAEFFGIPRPSLESAHSPFMYGVRAGYSGARRENPVVDLRTWLRFRFLSGRCRERDQWSNRFFGTARTASIIRFLDDSKFCFDAAIRRLEVLSADQIVGQVLLFNDSTLKIMGVQIPFAVA